MVTSKLMTGFQQPPVYLKKLRQQAMIQALRTKKRYRAVVGDAKDSKDFEIQVLNPQNPWPLLGKTSFYKKTFFKFGEWVLVSFSERRATGRNADARYIEDSSEKGLVNSEKLNSQNFTRAANKLLQDLFTIGALAKSPDQPAILHIGEVGNDIQTYFDTDLFLQTMKRDLLASNRVRISTTEGLCSKASDKYAKEVSAKLEAGDPFAVIQPRPFFSLSGKIIEETSRVDKVTQKDF